MPRAQKTEDPKNAVSLKKVEVDMNFRNTETQLKSDAIFLLYMRITELFPG